MPQTTRTLNPLPFEALEPHRFEDLVRQLAYDFKSWRMLEATGRMGGDEGFDARGWEIAIAEDVVDVEEGGEEIAETTEEHKSDRKWLIQCKREKAIGPAKIDKYISEINPLEAEELYGLVFAAACDFSKKTRDTLREKCRALGIAEIHVWGKAEIEDMLFQPKNDGLLFAYFGISLRIRRRSIKTAIRSRMVMKRKIKRVLDKGAKRFNDILLRDPEAENYPYIHDGKSYKDHLWTICSFDGDGYDSMNIKLKTYDFYWEMDGESWDVANALSDHDWSHQNPWLTAEERQRNFALKRELHEFENSLPKGTTGVISVIGGLKYEDVLEIDEDGDEAFEGAHFFVSYKAGKPPFFSLSGRVQIPAMTEEIDGRYNIVAPPRTTWNPDPKKRIKVFPDKFRVPLSGEDV